MRASLLLINLSSFVAENTVGCVIIAGSGNVTVSCFTHALPLYLSYNVFRGDTHIVPSVLNTQLIRNGVQSGLVTTVSRQIWKEVISLLFVLFIKQRKSLLDNPSRTAV